MSGGDFYCLTGQCTDGSLWPPRAWWQWTTVRPTKAGFYYWQGDDLRRINEDAVRLVQVSRYKNREGFNCHTLTRLGDACPPVFDCDLGQEPPGRWAGPFPQPS